MELTAGLLDELTTAVSQAAAAIMSARAGTLAARTKADRTPVTAADEAAEAVLRDALSRLLPGVPVVSEEAAERPTALPREGRFVLVDPLDGTRELLDGRDEFTVNLAVVSNGRPVLGIIAAPALDTVWRTPEGGPAERLRLAAGAPVSAARARTTIHSRGSQPARLVAVISRLHHDPRTEAFLARLPSVERVACGSALKFCRLAEGAADVYPRLSPTREWDVAAGHALVAAAGGTMTAADGQPLGYGRCEQGFEVPGFIAWASPALASQLSG